MINQNDNQGKRPDQIEFSEKVAGYCFVGIMVILILLKACS